MSGPTTYDDGGVACDDSGLTIRHYYPWGSKRIPYSRIRGVQRLPLTVHRWRIWGSDDLRHWWNRDTERPTKDYALEIRSGRWVRPAITPKDVDTVEQMLSHHLMMGR